MYLLEILPPTHVVALEYHSVTIADVAKERTGANIDAEEFENTPAVEMIHEFNCCHIPRGDVHVEASKTANRSEEGSNKCVIRNHIWRTNRHLMDMMEQRGLQPRADVSERLSFFNQNLFEEWANVQTRVPNDRVLHYGDVS